MTSSRLPMIAGNWKMNGLAADGLSLASGLASCFDGADSSGFEMVICPPFTLLGGIQTVINGSPIRLGAQNCHAAGKGAHTGDISTAMLADIGCSHVIVGHSERRTDCGETDADVKAKAAAVLAAGMTAIICIGETEAERDAGKTLAVVETQLAGSMPDGVTSANCIVAYEPVWAIGTGRTPSNEEVQEVHAHIRGQLTTLLGAEAANGIRLLYGGSMKPGNAADLIALPDVDGGLIGGASLTVDDFWGIAQAV